MPVANAGVLAGTIPGARLRVFEDAGHLVFVGRFADVNREVVTFLKPRGRVSQQREVEELPAGVWRLFSTPSQALRRWLEKTRSPISPGTIRPEVVPLAEVPPACRRF